MVAALILDEEDDRPCTSEFRHLGQSSQAAENQADISLKREREFEGRCGDCGLQTHTFLVDSATNMDVKVPLTIIGEVHRGRCLLCYPVKSFTSSIIVSLGSGVQSETSLQQGLIQEAFDILASDDADIIDILAIMRQLPLNEHIHEKACKRLWVLTWDEDFTIAIGRVGGITLLLQTMERFPHNPRLQRFACEALQNIAANSYNCQEIILGGGVSLLVQAMLLYADLPSLQLCGCTALASIAMCSREYHTYIKQAGGLQAILYAMKRYYDHKSVVLGAFQALQVLGHDPRLKEYSESYNRVLS